MIDGIRAQIEESVAVKQRLLVGDLPEMLARLVAETITAIRRGNRVFFAGNGGSATDAMHLAAELVVRFRLNRAPLAALALGANQANLTATGNDFDFSQVFVRELRALARPGDLLLALSTSGNSPNIVACVEEAPRLGVTVFALTGETGGRLVSLCPCLRVPSMITARIQESHIMLGHIFCDLVETACALPDEARR